MQIAYWCYSCAWANARMVTPKRYKNYPPQPSSLPTSGKSSLCTLLDDHRLQGIRTSVLRLRKGSVRCSHTCGSKLKWARLPPPQPPHLLRRHIHQLQRRAQSPMRRRSSGSSSCIRSLMTRPLHTVEAFGQLMMRWTSTVSGELSITSAWLGISLCEGKCLPQVKHSLYHASLWVYYYAYRYPSWTSAALAHRPHTPRTQTPPPGNFLWGCWSITWLVPVDIPVLS